MINYPKLKEGAKIGVTAPSSGVGPGLHRLVTEAEARMKKEGYETVLGETVWTQNKAKSAPAAVRAEELNRMLQDSEIDLIFPPWGGELLIETLEYIEFGKIPPKWIIGYSDVSLLLLAVTLQTGIATAHGTNLIDLRGEYSDGTTAMWEQVLRMEKGESIVQHSSEKFQEKWDFANPSPSVFRLTEETVWKTVSREPAEIEGRLLGGCIDVIRHLAGTPYGDVSRFRKKYTEGEPIIWYLENCELSTADLRRSLVQMKLAGWFGDCAGILFGRSPANQPVEGYSAEDVYQDIAQDLGVPVIYDIDCGHVPPQITFINGAFAKVKAGNGKGTVVQQFR